MNFGGLLREAWSAKGNPLTLSVLKENELVDGAMESGGSQARLKAMVDASGIALEQLFPAKGRHDTPLPPTTIATTINVSESVVV
jgi:hypothetical protein